METDWLQEAISREATPRHARLESTELFCVRHNIKIKQYYYQVSKEENKKAILETVLNTAKKSAPEVFETLVKKAIAGDMKAMDIYVDSVVKLAKNLDIKSDGKPMIFVPSEILNKNDIKPHTSPESHS